MNLDFGRSNGHEEAASFAATEFAEVVYETDEVLVVSVAADLAEDALLTGALMIAPRIRAEASLGASGR